MQAWTPPAPPMNASVSHPGLPQALSKSASAEKPSKCGTMSVKECPLSFLSEMSAVEDFASLAHAHWEFACWQRVKHRARTFALISFPDSHPFRKAVEDICTDLDSVQYEARCCLYKIVRRHGEFRGSVNGWWFEDPEKDLFQSDARKYHDCPEYMFGRGIRRDHELPLFGLATIHCVETRGRAFLEAAERLVKATIPGAKRRLDRAAKVFEKDCKRVERHLKKVKVCKKHVYDVLLCLQRWGIPGGAPRLVVEFLVGRNGGLG